MAKITSTIDPQTRADHTSAVVTAAGIIGALYYGSEIFIPLALAVLLSFAMAPAVKVLGKLGLGRALPVIITVLFTFVLLAGVAALIASQFRDLSSDLPKYESTMVRKIQTVKGMTNTGAMKKIEAGIAKLTQALGHSAPGDATSSGAQANAPGPQAGEQERTQPPLPVEVVQPSLGPLQAVMLVSAPLLHPLSTAFIVLIFVVFILLQREDLRNRAIRLFGASDLQRSTAAINDGGKRLSRYLLAQCALNTAAGATVGFALWLIGVPSPILLGIVFAIARFVPYIGPVIGAILPIALATAVDPGWSMSIWTLGALIGIETVVGQVVEPFAYGHNTGLSPIAIVISATFWTALWGPVGLFLSTPLTVCLVVIGRHVESLAFLNVLLGDQPALTLSETFYQRMLANDPVEVAHTAQNCLHDMSVAHYYDDVALPGLLMAQEDAENGRLDRARQEKMKETALEVIDDLQDAADEIEDPRERPRMLLFGRSKAGHAKDVGDSDLLPENVPAHLRSAGSVLCVGARGPLDDATAAMLAQVLKSHGIGAVTVEASALSRAALPSLNVSSVEMIVVAALDGSSPAFLRFILRRLRRHAPGVELVVGTWWRSRGRRETDDEVDEVVSQTKVATLLDTVRFCFADRTARATGSPPRLSVAS